MTSRTLVLVLTCLVTACTSSPTAHAKPTAPVIVEHNAPKTMQSGDEVTTVIRFIAETDLERLVVSVSPYSGIELVLRQDAVEFFDLKRGDSREIEVQIRLTNDEVGYLSVFATTTNTLNATRTKSIAIRYGTIGTITQQKMRPQNIEEDAKGSTLILMPGSPR